LYPGKADVGDFPAQGNLHGFKCVQGAHTPFPIVFGIIFVVFRGKGVVIFVNKQIKNRPDIASRGPRRVGPESPLYGKALKPGQVVKGYEGIDLKMGPRVGIEALEDIIFSLAAVGQNPGVKF
jgi:hypothetical protein